MIGVDLVKIERIEKMIERFGDKALKRFLNDKEIELITTPSRAAGFWAAKEAASKAIQTGIGSECSFHDIELSLSPKGAPLLSYSNQIKIQFNIKSSSLSITHDGDYAIAVVAVEQK